MEKIYCTYHPTKGALWHCPKCGADLCSSCITRKSFGGHTKSNALHLCPRCETIAKKISLENVIEPFWNRLPQFFAYPFHIEPMIFISIVALLGTIFSGPYLTSSLVRILLWAILIKYSFAVLKNTAQGNLKPPEIDIQTITDEFFVVFKQYGIFFLVGLSFMFILGVGGPVIGIAFLALAILTLPAMIIVLATSGSVFHALNPLVSGRMAWRIGPTYLLMYFFLIILAGAPATILHFINTLLPQFVSTFLLSFANCYYTIVSYYLMGYVIFQNHEAIGYEVDFSDHEMYTTAEDSDSSATSDILNRVNVYIKEGKHEDAIALIQSETNGAIEDPDLAERYYNLLKLKERTPDMLRHARVYLDLLAKENKKGKLCEVYQECQTSDPNFSGNASAMFKVASCMNEAGDHKGAIEIYNRFIKASPRDPLVPKAYFLAANIFYEKLLSPSKASKILKSIIKVFPNHEIIPYAEKYLRQISQHG